MRHVRPFLGFIVIGLLLTATTGYAQRIPAGTPVSVRMIDSISSDHNWAGQTFRASLAAPLRINNRTVFPRGTDARVRLLNVTQAGTLRGRSRLMLELTSVGGYPVRSGAVQFEGRSQSGRAARSAGIGAAAGTGAGALLGGGTGAAVGGVVGAGAGLASRAGRGGRPVFLGSESLVNFRLATPIHVR